MVLNQRKSGNIKQSRQKVLQQNRVRYSIKQAQTYMLDLVEKLSHIKPFNNTVLPSDCIDRLVAHRITSKFHVDNPVAAADLQSAAFANYINYDNSLSTDVDFTADPALDKARIFLYKAFKGFKVDFSDVRSYSVTPGETFISSGGEVSILAKLFDRNHWTVTANCLDDACMFIYHNISFKRAAKRHIFASAGRITRKERRKLFFRFRNKADVGFHVFKHLLIKHVLILVDGARASSVPKSNEKRRFINIEAMFSVIVQRAIASEFLMHLRYMGNDLSNTIAGFEKDVTGMFLKSVSAQKLHGLLIKSSKYATIDFSNASDSVLVAAINALFPKQVADVLLRARSHFVIFDDTFHEPKKLSSMGNGFTFEVMTALLYSIARAFSTDVRVYGDDVIIPNEYAVGFVRACKLIGFTVNEDKTFINSFFRESCGYFYSDHINDYITSFDFGQILSLSDVIITCNKLSIIIHKNQVSYDLREVLEFTRNQLNALVHASRKGPLPKSDSECRKYMALYMYDEGYEKKQKRSKELNLLRTHYVEKNRWYFNNCQISSSDVSLVYLPFFVPKKSSHMFANGDELKVLLPALYSGKRLNATLRGVGRWVDLPAFISKDGTVTLLSNLASSQKVWVDRLEGVFSAHDRK